MERPMNGKSQRRVPTPDSLARLLQHCLPSRVWRQAYAAFTDHNRGHQKRWQLHPVLTVMLLLTWTQGDSLPEKFETARACYVALHPKRRQPGKTCSGFQKALLRVPVPVLRA